MRFSEYRAKAPVKDAAAPKVVAVVEQALAALGADRDPECLVAWGDDPAVRYVMFVPTPAGLIQLAVRVAVPGEGPRAGGKVIRWSRVQLGELAVEIQGGHRLVTFQVESQVLNGADAKADAITAFAQVLFAAVDGRVAPRAQARGSAVAGRTTTPGAKRTSPAKRSSAAKRASASKGPAA
jgi:hypothetical protein